MARNTPLATLSLALAVAVSGAVPSTAVAASEGGSPRNFSPALSPMLELTRDYVPVSELPAKSLAKSVTDAGCNPCWGQTARYTTFSTPVQTFDVRRYDGHKVVVLVPVNHPRAAQVTPERLRTLVDRLDVLYAMYAELLGWEPTKTRDPLGKQIFAFLPNIPERWYGLALAPGDSSEYSNAVLDEGDLDDDVLTNVWVHELAHNFDPIRQWDYGADAFHDWTTFMQVWTARRLARMDDDNLVRWDDSEARQVESRWARWRNNPAAFTWQRCVVDNPRPQDCADNVNTMQGVLMASAARHVDPAVIRQWLRTVRTDASPAPVGNDARRDYILRTLADATRSNTRCVAQHFGWPSGAGLDAAAQYATPFAGCLDSDNDGSRRFDDCDDTRASVRPSASETADGRDNDCNGVVDERLVSETTLGDFANSGFSGTAIGGFPVVATGEMATTADVDAIRIDGAIPPRHANVRLCATGDTMRLGALNTIGELWGPMATAAPGTCTLISASQWSWRGFSVNRVGTTTGAASWRLEIDRFAEGWPRPRPITLAASGNNGVSAVVDAARIPGGAAGVEVRWTGSGGGVLKTGPLANADSLIAPSLPAATMDRATSERQQLRAQLFRNGLPIEEPSRAFTVATEGFALSSGVTVASNLPAGRNEERWYIDVPDGASRLVINTTSAQNIDLHAARVTPIAPVVAIPSIAAAPARNLANASAVTPSGNETLTINSPAAGRWYLTPTNNGGAAAGYTLRATLDAVATPIRAGGYFNPGRPGHGLFLHPAGGEWAGLWYTYDRDNLPTWYYLQGAAPGGNGQWNGTIFRSRWDGVRGELHPIGNAVLTPGAERGFSFSYNLDGVAGSEAFRPFGRGCPAIGATSVDASQHYFDPVRSGSGYSVQLMATPAAYEFFAAFVYDSRGMPRFLAAERNGVGALDASITLQQLRCFCPDCAHAAVTRTDAGSLRRVFNASGVLQSITLDAGFVDGLRGNWDVTDTVQMLDPTRRSQGCTL